MRLIDADKIRYSDLSDGRVPDGVWCTWKDRIDVMPTVKAIPIEWLEGQLDVFGDGFYDLRLVIKHWEKEHEIN